MSESFMRFDVVVASVSSSPECTGVWKHDGVRDDITLEEEKKTSVRLEISVFSIV